MITEVPSKLVERGAWEKGAASLEQTMCSSELCQSSFCFCIKLI